MGSLVTLVFLACLTFVFPEIANYLIFGFFVISLVLGIPASKKAANTVFFKKDPSEIVIDEFSGMALALLFLPFDTSAQTIFLWILAFGLFRYFDIKKPSYIDKLQSLPGGWGIMMDDIAAGFVSFVIVQTLKIIMQIFF